VSTHHAVIPHAVIPHAVIPHAVIPSAARDLFCTDDRDVIVMQSDSRSPAALGMTAPVGDQGAADAAPVKGRSVVGNSDEATIQ
jgi:hypothetical protein